MAAAPPEFRTGSVLATVFTGTLTERHGAPLERIPTADRLQDWLTANDLAVDACSPAELELARELREAIHDAATAAATGTALPPAAVRALNEHSARGRAAAVLTPEGERRWRLGAGTASADTGSAGTAPAVTAPAGTASTGTVEDALGVIAADAIAMLAGARDGRLALCASPTCRAVFLDTSQSRTRRWCDMNSCGNRQKKARFQARHRPGPDPAG